MKASNSSLLLRVCVLLLVLILCGIAWITALALPMTQNETVGAKAEISLPALDTENTAVHKLVLKDTDGVVCVYLDDTLLYKTDIPIKSLPQQDRIALSKGIEVTDETEMHQLLEDFGA